MISCQPKRSRESNFQYQTPLQRAAAAVAESAAPPQSAGGDYEGSEYSDHAPPLPVVSKVFHLAGTVVSASASDRDQAKLIEEIRVKGKPSKRPIIAPRKSDSKRSVDRSSSKSSVNNNDDAFDRGGAKNGAPFKAVLRNPEKDEIRDSKMDDAENVLRVFDVVKTEVRAVDELDAEYRVGGSGDVIACNDIPMERETVAGGGGAEDYVYDLYYSTNEGSEAKLDLSFLDTYLDVKPYRNEDLDALENYGIVEPASMLQRGFLGVEDEDSNDEDNWRNDYPDSDPEDTFDREEPDYDQCGFVHDAKDEDEYSSPVSPRRDDYLSDMLKIGMRLRNRYGEDEDDEGDDEEEEDQEDVDELKNPTESRAYLEYKKRTIAQLNLRSDDDGDEDDEDDDDEDAIDVYGEGLDLGIGRREEKLNYFAYDEKLDKGSESDSFEDYDDDF